MAVIFVIADFSIEIWESGSAIFKCRAMAKFVMGHVCKNRNII